MSESYLSLKQLTELLDIHENTIKGYMNKHPEFVRFDKVHNRYRIQNMFSVQQENMLQMQMQFNQVLVHQIEEEKKELKEAFHQEIGELKQLVNRHESERVSELRLSLEEAAASMVVIEEELVAERKKSLWQKLFGKSLLTKFGI